MSSKQTAPGDLELVRAFVNTKDFDDGSERFDGPGPTRDWLTEHGLLSPGARIGPGDVQRAMDLREAVRAALLAHHDRATDAGAVEQLSSLAGDVPLRVSFRPDGSAVLEPAGKGMDEALGRVLAVIHTSIVDGTWPRMKVCPADDCRWAFYDHSKNRSGKWCDMAVCGNRAKAREYRARHREHERG